MDRQWDGTVQCCLERCKDQWPWEKKSRHVVVGAMMVSRVEENQLVKGNDFASQPSNWFQPLEVMLPRRVQCSERIQLSFKSKNTNTNHKHKHNYKSKEVHTMQDTIADCSWLLSTASSGALSALSVTRKKTNVLMVAFWYYNIRMEAFLYYDILKWQYFDITNTLMVAFWYCKHVVNKSWEI